MELRQLTDRVFYSLHNKEVDRPVLGYINGRKYSLMVDSGNSKRHVQLFNEAIINEGLRKPDFIAITHWHWDHSFGMNAIEGITFANKKTNEKLAEIAKWKWTDSEMKKRLETKLEIEFADSSIRKEYPVLSEILVTTSDISYNGTMEIDLGGIVAELHPIVSPHSEDCTCIFVPQERVLFIGDAVGVDYYNNCYLDKSKLNSLLIAIEGIDFDICVMGHADPASKLDILNIIGSLLDR
ncbi:metallo-beta-lactamase superfamily protein [Desulfosporosinus acididurans]|uniref:Metallo-beta-lactamase superfamily protein n=1 Tax=Desulfosporosinus acididurans TaxID=476652 RepID=A0A0J1FQB5_9FIRM|nr:MBL fold metallo-hydrolase [Desulfosporosinus acididurans]KLU65679.1 metallo-beta-lactamase superfamily protein [Desulfosporosinus acididurans]